MMYDCLISYPSLHAYVMLRNYYLSVKINVIVKSTALPSVRKPIYLSASARVHTCVHFKLRVIHCTLQITDKPF